MRELTNLELKTINGGRPGWYYLGRIARYIYEAIDTEPISCAGVTRFGE